MPLQLDIENLQDRGRNVYTYAADGRKLSVQHLTGSSLTDTKTTDYVGNRVYENGALKYTLFSDGYIDANNEYHFYVRDYLGNVCSVLDSNGFIVQRNDYYPFGMPFAETSNAEQDVQPYKYNGKELDRGLKLNLYDYSARQMDPALGRFTTMDPLAEKYYAWSPYHYVGNNPVNITDPTGMDWYINKDGNYYWQEGSKEIDGYTNIGNSISVQTDENTYINYYQNAGIQANQAVNAFDLITQSSKLQNDLLGKNSVLSKDSQSALYNGLVSQSVDAFARPIGEAAVEYGIGSITGAVAGKVISKVTGKLINKVTSNNIAKESIKWIYGSFKSEAKWANQFAKRGWTPVQVTEAITKGKKINATNMINKGNSATRYVHPKTGQSVVIDNVTKELLHIGGPGFKY